MKLVANYNLESLRDTIDTEKDLLDMRKVIACAIIRTDMIEILHSNGFTVSALHDYLNMADVYFYLIKSDGSEDCEEL